MDSTRAVRAQTERRRRPPGGGCGPAAETDVRENPAGGLSGIADDTAARWWPADVLASALTIRRVEQKLLELFSRGLLHGTVHTCIGQELVGVAVARVLRPGDFIFSNHRGHGHYLAWTDDLEGLVAEVMGRASGACGGRGGSQHLCRGGFFSNGIQGGIAPVAAGLAMARKLRGQGGIAVVFLGDGTLGQGVVYETLNIASRWSLPLLVVVEDNGIAQSTPRRDAMAGTVRGRARAFGIACRSATTSRPAELLEAARQAVDFVRAAAAPLVLHIRTRRLMAHSKSDDTRDAAVVERLARRDPLNRLLACRPAGLDALLTRIDRRIEAAVATAQAAPPAGIETDAESCGAGSGRSGPGAADRAPRRPRVAGGADVAWMPWSFEPLRVADGIRQALAEALAADERVLLLGEDIRDPYGGAFKVTAGLSTRFPDRVRNTPISEAGIVGIATGLALAGLRPVVEIMFGDFILLAADQWVNHAAKFAWMYNGAVRVPLIVRTPMGGYRGYGPTHSQCLEKHLLGVPGTRVLALHRRCCPKRLYAALLAEADRPTLVVENKLLYAQRAESAAAAGFEVSAAGEPFATVRLAAPAPAVTVVAYGGAAAVAEEAVTRLREDEEVGCELLLPTQLYPLDVGPVADSLRRTGRLVVVEEGQLFAGFGAELLARLTCEDGLGRFSARRVGPAACPVPASRPAEALALPSVDQVLRAIMGLLDNASAPA